MKRLIPLIFILILTSCVEIREALFTPPQIKEYCHRITATENNQDNSMAMCIKQERDAEDKLLKMDIPTDIGQDCRELSEKTGGSYQVMLTCVKQRLKEL
jgi:hypothetical protein